MLDSLLNYARINTLYQKTDPFDAKSIDSYLSNKSELSTLIESLSSALGLQTGDAFDYFLEGILARIVPQKHDTPQKEVAFIECPAGAGLSLFGDLKGNFHSLLRSLNCLHQQGVLDNTLKLQQPEKYLIFNGNTLKDSSFLLETFITILLLCHQNPGRIFLIKGISETETKDILAPFEQNIPLNSLVGHFLEIQPDALYCISHRGEWWRISHFPAKALQLDETTLTKHQGRVPYTLVKRRNRRDLFLAFIGADPHFERLVSLQKIPSEEARTTWTLVSADDPLTINPHLPDAWVDIDPAQSGFTHHFRPHGSETFLSQSYDATYGLMPNPSTRRSLSIGCSLDLSKTSQTLGRRIQNGIFACISEQNPQEPLQLSPLFFDDRYTPYHALKNINDLLSVYKTNIILSPLGTPTTASFLPLAQTNKIVILFPHTGSHIFRQSDLINIYHLRASYEQEAKALIYYAHSHLQIKRFAVFYQNDLYGISALRGAKAAFQELGIEEWIETSYLRNNPNVEGPAKSILEFEPEATLLFSTPSPSEELIRRLTVPKCIGKFFLGISFLTDTVRDFLQEKGIDMIMSRVTPPPFSNDLEIAFEYRQCMERYYNIPTWSCESFEAYINTRLFYEILHHCDGDITPESLKTAVHSFQHHTFKGLPLHYDPETHTLYNKVFINPTPHEWIEWDHTP